MLVGQCWSFGYSTTIRVRVVGDGWVDGWMKQKLILTHPMLKFKLEWSLAKQQNNTATSNLVISNLKVDIDRTKHQGDIYLRVGKRILAAIVTISICKL